MISEFGLSNSELELVGFDFGIAPPLKLRRHAVGISISDFELME